MTYATGGKGEKKGSKTLLLWRIISPHYAEEYPKMANPTWCNPPSGGA